MEDLIYGYLNQKMEKSNKLTFFFLKYIIQYVITVM